MSDKYPTYQELKAKLDRALSLLGRLYDEERITSWELDEVARATVEPGDPGPIQTIRLTDKS